MHAYSPKRSKYKRNPCTYLRITSIFRLQSALQMNISFIDTSSLLACQPQVSRTVISQKKMDELEWENFNAVGVSRRHDAKFILGARTTVLYLAISSWNSLSKASFGSSLIFGLFLIFFARFAYLLQAKEYNRYLIVHSHRGFSGPIKHNQRNDRTEQQLLRISVGYLQEQLRSWTRDYGSRTRDSLSSRQAP